MSAEPQIFAEDLAVGQTFAGRPHTIDEEQFGLFAQLTGDDHPIHYDEAFAAKTRFRKRVAHGLLLMSMTALGATEMSHRLRDAMVALTDQRCRFLKPVFIGDVVTSRFEVLAIHHKPFSDMARVQFSAQLFDGAAEMILDGEHAYLLRWRRATTRADPNDAA
jgi:3-hydroxybutyryl-CoA dehydratase